ncbi:unnamed protein product [Prorocentrum cordatum]|uniref:Uncharacterized protein n=1 Tax=Prorocentrum cordatum TaxID=2364126 RepID=A0ABN9QV03_9DINO|nr:unnamed protein product [Polarella glacialis]
MLSPAPSAPGAPAATPQAAADAFLAAAAAGQRAGAQRWPGRQTPRCPGATTSSRPQTSRKIKDREHGHTTQSTHLGHTSRTCTTDRHSRHTSAACANGRHQ